jgi:hypothetical protein
MSERALGLDEVVPEPLLDPVRKGLAHRVRAEVAPEAHGRERPPHGAPGLDPPERSMSVLA